jgi:hypothetical protein
LVFKINKHVKTLVNPDVVAGFLNPHFPVYIAGYHSVNLNGQTVEGPFNEPSADPEIRLNHYFTGTIPCQVDTYKNENTIFLIRSNRGNIPPRFGHFF